MKGRRQAKAVGRAIEKASQLGNYNLFESGSVEGGKGLEILKLRSITGKQNRSGNREQTRAAAELASRGVGGPAEYGHCPYVVARC